MRPDYQTLSLVNPIRQTKEFKPTIGDVIMDHREFASGRGTTIQAGLFAGLAGHGVDSSLKVMEIMYKILAFVVCRLIRS